MRYAPFIFLQSPITRSWPIWARYGSVLLLLLAATLLQWWLWPTVTGHPLVLFYGVVVLSAVLFDHGAGYFAVALSGLIVSYWFVEPFHSLAIEYERDRVGLIAFIIVGCLSSALLENMHVALHRLSLANEQLMRTDKEKDLMLREFSHRMKNDLTILLSLLVLQARELKDKTAQAALAATADRIKVIARVQDRLRRTDREAVVDGGDFIEELCSDLKLTLIGLRPITLAVLADRGLLAHSDAVAIGLIVNELLTNAVKYAFPNEQGGNIAIRFTQDHSRCQLVVEDDGVGTAEYTREQASGLGTRLIRTMVAQLNGSIESRQNEPHGTSVTITFSRN
jgi:two-component sensor histidine kinase